MNPFVNRQQSVHFGAAYYPEYHRTDRLDIDLDLMVDAGFTVIRVGESVWSTWEPEEGVFNLEWLRPVLDGAHARGLSVVVGTPTYAVPPWLARRYPEIAGERRDGKTIPWGARQEADYSHAAYRFYADRIAEKVITAYRDHPAVIGFQLDNEPGLEFFHGHAVFEAFKNWLRRKYDTVDRINDEWGLTYWSHRLSTWDDLWHPRGNAQPQYDLDWRRFQAEIVNDFISSQLSIAHRLKRDDQFAMTCVALDRPVPNERSLASELDVMTVNIYYTMQAGLAVPRRVSDVPASWITNGAGDLVFTADRAFAAREEPFYITETNAGAAGRSAMNYPAFDGQWRQAAWALIGRGASMIEYWHWHSTQDGTETFWLGVLPHDLTPGRAYAEIAQLGDELRRAGDRVVGLEPLSDVDFLYSVPSKWGMASAPPHLEKPVLGELQYDEDAYHRFFTPFYIGAFQAGLQPRIVHDAALVGPDGSWLADPTQEATKRPILVVPALYIADDRTLDWLAAYVEAGGHLMLGPRTGYADTTARARTDVKPARLADIAGASYQEFSNVPSPMTVTEDGTAVGAAKTWTDLVVADTARTVLRHTDPMWAQWSVLTEADHGKGKVTVMAALPDDELARSLFSRLGKSAWGNGESVIATRALNRHQEEIVILHNWSSVEANTIVPVNVEDVLSGDTITAGSSLQMPAWGVRVFAVASA